MSSNRRATPSSALHNRVVEVIDAIREVSKEFREACHYFQSYRPDGKQRVDQHLQAMRALLDLIVAVEPQTAGIRAARVAAAKLKSGLSADYMPPAVRAWTPFVQLVQKGLRELDRARLDLAADISGVRTPQKPAKDALREPHVITRAVIWAVRDGKPGSISTGKPLAQKVMAAAKNSRVVNPKAKDLSWLRKHVREAIGLGHVKRIGNTQQIVLTDKPIPDSWTVPPGSWKVAAKQDGTGRKP